jgi:hypothetical protein
MLNDYVLFTSSALLNVKGLAHLQTVVNGKGEFHYYVLLVVLPAY